MSYEQFIERIEQELPKLQAEYKRHADLHKKNARFWLFAT